MNLGVLDIWSWWPIAFTTIVRRMFALKRVAAIIKQYCFRETIKYTNHLGARVWKPNEKKNKHTNQPTNKRIKPNSNWIVNSRLFWLTIYDKFPLQYANYSAVCSYMCIVYTNSEPFRCDTNLYAATTTEKKKQFALDVCPCFLFDLFLCPFCRSRNSLRSTIYLPLKTLESILHTDTHTHGVHRANGKVR